MIERLLNWIHPEIPLPDVTGMTLSEASDAMKYCPFHPAAHTLIKALIQIVERHEAEIKELKSKIEK